MGLGAVELFHENQKRSECHTSRWLNQMHPASLKPASHRVNPLYGPPEF
jgi:hypothetical protein